MLAIELISDYIVPLKTSDTALSALSLMEEFKVKHLPIVNEETFLGLISEDDIYSFNQFEEAIGAHPLSKAQVSLLENKHIYEVISSFKINNLSLLPVINSKNRYLGSIISLDLVKNLAEITGTLNPGSILVLEMNVRDYSLSEIAQIVESNNTRIINFFVHTYPNSTKMEVTLKLNTMDIDAVLQTFNRYNYTVKAFYAKEKLDEKLNENYDSLMNYLSI